MDSCSKKLDQIKVTIDEIKEDISKMKVKNNSNLNSMMDSMNMSQELVDKIKIIDQGINESLYKKYDSYNLDDDNDISPSLNGSATYEIRNTNPENKNKFTLPTPIDTTSMNLNNNQAQMLQKYQTEIDNLKATIASLEEDKKTLNKQLKDQKKEKEKLKEEIIKANQTNREILSKIMEYFSVSSPKELLSTLESIVSYVNNPQSKLKKELIAKMSNLYLTLAHPELEAKGEKVEVDVLWKWVKHLVDTYTKLMRDRERNLERLNEVQGVGDMYYQCFEEICQEFGLSSIEEIKAFIFELLSVNNINKKRANKN